MKTLSLILALCAFIATPAFANDDAAATTTEAPAAHDTAAPAHGKMKAKKGKRGAKKAKKEAAAPAEGTTDEAPKH